MIFEWHRLATSRARGNEFVKIKRKGVKPDVPERGAE